MTSVQDVKPEDVEPEDLKIGARYYILPKAVGTEEQWEVEMFTVRYAGRNSEGELLWRLGKDETEEPTKLDVAWIGRDPGLRFQIGTNPSSISGSALRSLAGFVLGLFLALICAGLPVVGAEWMRSFIGQACEISPIKILNAFGIYSVASAFVGLIIIVLCVIDCGKAKNFNDVNLGRVLTVSVAWGLSSGFLLAALTMAGLLCTFSRL